MQAFCDPWSPYAFALDLRCNPCAEYFVAANWRGGVAGYMGWWNQMGVGHITKVAVAARLRGHGFGALLLEAAMSSARDQGCSSMQLEVRASNHAARSLYLKLGFEEVDAISGFYEGDDAVVMATAL